MKYELTDESIDFARRKLYRIKALKDFGDVKKGDLGGYIECEQNLSQESTAWVYDRARVYGETRVCGGAQIGENAQIRNNIDYAVVQGFGSVCRATTFFRENDKGIAVRCGCFYGDLDKFRERVKETHRDSKLAKEYLMLADLMEYKFSDEEK